MPHQRIHSEIDCKLTGTLYQNVHAWMDGTFDGTNGRTHWVNRHHLQAINERYPKESIENLIARLHVMVDWLFYYRIICLPKDKWEVIKRLGEVGIHA